MADMVMTAKVRVWTDWSTAVGICGRPGFGKRRHVQTHTLWVQERVLSGAIEVRKLNGRVNQSELFTKHLTSRDRVTQLIELLNCEYRDGRLTIAFELSPAAINAIQSEHDPDINNQSPRHDPDVPHLYETDDMDKLFEQAVAPDEMDCAPTGKWFCSRHECRVCFPSKYEFGPATTNSEAWFVTGHGRSLPRQQNSVLGASLPGEFQGQ